LQIAPLAVVFIVAHEFILFLIRNQGDIDFVKFRQENQVLLDSPKFKSCVELLPEIIRTKLPGAGEPLKAQSS
ncbi:MAG: hypothetical protein WCH11_07760, partial [Bdellovibrio sp.]